MATLVLDRSDLELRADGSALAVYESGERRGTVALNLVDRLILQGSVKIDSTVLTRLAEAGVATVLLSRRQSRRVAFMTGASHSDAAIRVAQYQLTLDELWCSSWSVRIVLAKIRGQRRLLRKALSQRPDCRKSLTDAITSLQNVINTICHTEAISVDTVRGLEGAAAAAYFRGFTTLFPDSVNFTGRNRRPPRDPVNACLSLGYTLLHFEAVRACHVAGLDPMIGFLHRPAFGRESMACDLVESIRSQVDEWIWEQFRSRALRADGFSHDKGACLLNKSGRAHFYASWEQFAAAPRRHLRRQCEVLVRVLRARGGRLLEPQAELEDEEI